MRSLVVFLLLGSVRVLSQLFYRFESRWIGVPPADRWKRIRVVALLNHTSLYEPILLGVVPLSFVWRVARHGVVPAASKTTKRPIVGLFFKLIARNVVSISRERDHTWAEVLASIEPDSMVAITPEGRMKRRNGLDSHGQPMTVRGGIADILEAIPEGRMLIAYSGGLHHVQAPGELLPRVFKTVRINLEVVEIADYRREVLGERDPAEWKALVKADMERRRDLNCPPPEPD